MLLESASQIGQNREEQMDRDTDLFVQAFWVKCREIDTAGTRLHGRRPEERRPRPRTSRRQEYSDVPDGLPDAGPSLILTVHPNGEDEGRTLRFQGDVARSDVDGHGVDRHVAPSTSWPALEMPAVKARDRGLAHRAAGPPS